ncbi:BNR/Asp-box repeat domain protein [Aureobasidium sp. EXF-3400]|nr:BNR/Asp-box repeat domain protein [Aureobasidium sp. EXF-12344]KAI4778705.1 BNR/Asp-box repeat domain protein [Aureobasidium sp. EXF-3400]
MFSTLSLFTSALLASTTVAWPSAVPASFVQNTTVFIPPANWPDKGGSYARSVMLNQDCEQGTPTILATAAYNAPDGQYFLIHKSTDYGATWSDLSKAYFNGNASVTGGIILQPFLYELSQPFGKYQPGTILLSGNRIPGDFSSTNIQLYASTDKGCSVSWEYVSTVAYGGPPNTDNGAPCVWEPFILAYNNEVSVFYSDQRDPAYGQKLAHQSSGDLRSWGDVVNDVAYANYTQRPGMITMAQIGNGKWMCSYEVGLWPDPSAPYATHYKIADSPLEFGSVGDNELKTPEGISSAGPYTIWTPAGGPSGTIVVSDSTYDQFFLNTQNGDPGAWKNVSSQGHGVGYTRSLRVLPGNGGKTIQVYNGGMYGSNMTEFTVGDFIVPGPAGHGPGAQGFPACNHNSGGYGHGWGWGSPWW